jgi:ElaA protein
MPIRFQWSRLEQLSALQFHEIIAARERVFIVEQNCPYPDADGYDVVSWHLTGHVDGRLAAYLRIVDPGHKYSEASIGRVLTASGFRGLGLGKALMDEAIAGAARHYPRHAIRISAQAYLLAFYRGYGFMPVGEEYLEDDIPHIEMLRSAQQAP